MHGQIEEFGPRVRLAYWINEISRLRQAKAAEKAKIQIKQLHTMSYAISVTTR